VTFVSLQGEQYQLQPPEWPLVARIGTTIVDLFEFVIAILLASFGMCIVSCFYVMVSGLLLVGLCSIEFAFGV
jgi:hypothetical protein